MGIAGAIGVAPGTHTYLMSYYDLTDSEAVIGTVTTAGAITAASTIHVIGLIHESAADYAGIAGNVHFV